MRGAYQDKARGYVMLTPKQEGFCLSYIETGNATEAYRRNYSAKSMAEPTINRKAKGLIDNGKIRARLEELRKPVREAAQVTLKSHLDDLKRLRDLAEADAKYSAAVTAEMARGKVSGLYVDRVENVGDINLVINRPRGD